MISVEKQLLQELIDLKIRTLQEEIDKILEKWGYRAAEQFLADARDGTISDAEDDAVCLRNVLDDRDEARRLKQQWNAM